MAAFHGKPETVYELTFAANDYAGLLVADESDLDRLVGAFDGTPIAARWEPLRMFWETEGGRPVSDFARVTGGGLVFNARALKALGDLLEGRGERLPLEVIGGGEYDVFNVTRLVDALDEERSELAYFRSGRIMDVDRYEFIPDKLVGETIFKLPQFRRSPYYVTDAFVDRAERAELTGFDFECVWRKAARAGRA